MTESDAHEVGAATVGAATLAENMTLALRATIEHDGKIVLYGDTFQVTAGGAKSLLT